MHTEAQSTTGCAFLVYCLQLYVVDHGIECVQDAGFVLLRELGNIVEPSEHGGVFEEFPVFGLTEQIAHGGIEHFRELFNHVNSRFYFIALVLANDGVVGLNIFSELRL